MFNHLGTKTSYKKRNALVTAFSSLIALVFIGNASQAEAFSEDNYEVYFGDFNGDGKAGDIYYHHKDDFVLIHGDIAIPLQIAADGSYVLYEGAGSGTELKLANSALAGFTKGELNQDYHFTDVDGDGDLDIVASVPGSATSGSTLTDNANSAPIVVVNQATPENIPTPTPPALAQPSDFPGLDKTSIDKLQTLGGSFRVDESGAATYSIPIVTPAGTAGVAPEISLNYSSANGNGIAGLGWSLSGVGNISLCRKTKAQDGGSTPLTFRGGATFCLNGQRLLMIAGRYSGFTGATYRTEIESGVEVYVPEGVNGVPDYFEVRGKDGSIATYGAPGNDDSEHIGYVDGQEETFESSPYELYPILQWKIKEFRDSVGNKITYHYSKSSLGHYISRIDYAYGDGATPYARISFGYDLRSDPSYAYIDGYEFDSRKLLQSITTYSRVNGSLQEAHRYKLNYHADDDFKNDTLSRVESIQLCASGICHNETATHFTWGSDQILFDSSQTVDLGVSESASVLDFKTPDIDGDGRMDLVWLSVRQQYSGNYQYYVHYKQIDGYARSITAASYSSSELETKPLNIIDYNGDGRGDIAFRGKVYLATPSTSGGWSYSSGISAYTDNDKTLLADINADGMADLLELDGPQVKARLLTKDTTQAVTSSHFYKFGTQSSYQVSDGRCNFDDFSVSTGTNPDTGLETLTAWYFQNENASFGDFNNDGQMDIVASVLYLNKTGERESYAAGSGWYYKYLYQEYIAVFIRKGSSFSCERKILLSEGEDFKSRSDLDSFTGKWTIQPSADVNSDGLVDLIYSSKQDSGLWKYAINTGQDFLDAVSLGLDKVDGAIGFAPQWVDYNYDGYTDVVWHSHTENTSSNMRYKLWNPATKTYFNVRHVGPYSKNPMYLFDFNGDGRHDIVDLDFEDGQIQLRMGRSDDEATHASRVYKITDTLGNETDIHYAPLNFNDHYHSLTVQETGGSTGEICEQRRAPTIEEQYYEYCYVGQIAGNFNEFYRAINDPFDDYSVSFTPENAAPILDIAGSSHVVTSVSSSSPHEGDENNKASVSYFYERMRVQAAGRGGLGFRKLTTVDNQTGISTVTTYRQDWPFIGMPESTFTYASPNTTDSGIKLKEAFNEYAARAPDCTPGSCSTSKAYGPIQVWVDESIETTYALKDKNGKTQGAAVSTVVTTMTQDTYNNVTDMEVSTYEGTASGPLVQRVTTDNTYLDSDDAEFLGRLQSSIVTTHRPAAEVPTVTRSSSFTYYGMNGSCFGDESLRGLLCTETISGGATTKHFYDSFGNKTFTYATADGEGRHSSYTEYDDIGRYAEASYGLSSKVIGNGTPGTIYKQGGAGNVVNTGKITQRNRFGAVEISETYTGSSWLKTFNYYTSYGARYLTANANGSFSLSTASADTSFCPSVARYSAHQRVAGGAETKTCYDSLGREVRLAKRGFDGSWVYTDVVYDGYGRAYKTSEPYFSDSNTTYWTEVKEYDLLGRALKKALPFKVTNDSGAVTDIRATSSVAYDDETRTTQYTGPGVHNKHTGLTKTEIRNVLGEIIEVVEVDNGQNVSAHYEYNVFGKLTEMRDPSNNTTKITYNALGQKETLDDPDKGKWLYTYNKFGELLTQTDAKQQKTVNCYDFAGRLVTRYDYAAGTTGSCSSPGNYIGKSSWVYDTASDGLGQLQRETSETADEAGADGPVITKTYEYDTQGRLSTTETDMPGDGLQSGGKHYTKVTYDQFGRIAQNFDAARNGKDFSHTATQNQYNNHGYLELVTNADQSAVGTANSGYYEVVSMNARGQVTVSSYDNGNITTTTDYDPSTGRVKQIHTTGALHQTIQLLKMGWDTVGNLAYREDLGQEVNNTQRNLKETFGYDDRNRLGSYVVAKNGSAQTAITVDYDAIGNIENKSDVGGYSYGANNAGPHAVTAAGGVSYHYDKNGNLTSDGRGRSFEYTTFDKVKKVSKDTSSTKFYYDGSRSRYKRIDIDPTNRKTVTLYLGSVEKVFHSDLTQEWKRNIAGAVQITHKFIGSHAQGKVVNYLHRDHLGSVTAISSADGDLVESLAFDPWGARRETLSWEEALPSTIAKFFASNKPITTRGFTGHEMVDGMDIIHMNGRIYDATLGRFLQADPEIQSPTMIGSLNRYSYVMNNPLNAVDPTGYNWFSDRWQDTWRDIKPYVGAVVAVVLSIYAPWASQAWAPMVIGMISGAAGAAANGGNILKGIAMGAFGGGMSTHLITAAMAGGIMAEMNGGDFGSGFVAAGIGAAFGSHGGLEITAKKLIVSAVVGGVSSKITGGKFKNGAASSAFMYVLSARLRTAKARPVVRSETNTSGAPAARHRSPGIEWEVNDENIENLGVNAVDIEERKLQAERALEQIEERRKVLHEHEDYLENKVEEAIKKYSPDPSKILPKPVREIYKRLDKLTNGKLNESVRNSMRDGTEAQKELERIQRERRNNIDNAAERRKREVEEYL